MKLTIAAIAALLLPIASLGVNREQTADPPKRIPPSTTTVGRPTSIPPSSDPNRRVTDSPRAEVTTTTTSTTNTTTTTTTPAPPPTEAAHKPAEAVLTHAKPSQGPRCPQWHDAALAAGWTPDLLPRLDAIIWRESRCLPEVHNTKDPNSGSRGLTQINGYWCRPSKFFPHPAGWLGTEGVLTSCEDLFTPAVNLQAAKAIYDYGVTQHRCGWGPWSTKGSNWCSKRS